MHKKINHMLDIPINNTDVLNSLNNFLWFMRIETTKIGKWMAKVSIEIILLEIHIKTLLSTWVEIMMPSRKWILLQF